MPSIYVPYGCSRTAAMKLPRKLLGEPTFAPHPRRMIREALSTPAHNVRPSNLATELKTHPKALQSNSSLH